MLLLTLWVVLRFCCCYLRKWKWLWSPNTKVRRQWARTFFQIFVCGAGGGKRDREDPVLPNQVPQSSSSCASPDKHLTGCVNNDPNFQAKNWSSDRGRSSRHSVRGPPRPFLCQAGRGGYIISVWKGIEAVQILRTKYFFKAEMHTHCTKTNIKTTQREL